MYVHICVCVCVHVHTLAHLVLRYLKALSVYTRTHTLIIVSVEMSACFMLKLMYVHTGSETGIYSYPILTWHQKIKSIKAAITMHSHTRTHTHTQSKHVCGYYRIQAS